MAPLNILMVVLANIRSARSLNPRDRLVQGNIRPVMWAEVNRAQTRRSALLH